MREIFRGAGYNSGWDTECLGGFPQGGNLAVSPRAPGPPSHTRPSEAHGGAELTWHLAFILLFGWRCDVGAAGHQAQHSQQRPACRDSWGVHGEASCSEARRSHTQARVLLGWACWAALGSWPDPSPPSFPASAGRHKPPGCPRAPMLAPQWIIPVRNHSLVNDSLFSGFCL